MTMKSKYSASDEHELDELKELLASALSAVIAEFLEVELDRVEPHSRLTADLGMSPAAKKRLQREIAFIFDCAAIAMPEAMTVKELIDEVAELEFAHLRLPAAIRAFACAGPCGARA